jgi:hypothetical protein
VSPDLAAEYVEVVTGERVWRFDARFLRSSWRCIYGGGCRGLHRTQDPLRADGCCTEGAAFTDGEDFAIVSRAVAKLDPARWQYAATAKRIGWFKRLPNGLVGTRVVDGACIFLNRPGFVTGAGCALHFASLDRGERPIDGKPNVCWQFPLRRTNTVDVDGVEVSTIHPWVASDWKATGGERSWFCTSASEAFTAVDPVWQTLADELREITGAAVYESLIEVLRSR